jgi:hypothetical protein
MVVFPKHAYSVILQQKLDAFSLSIASCDVKGCLAAKVHCFDIGAFGDEELQALTCPERHA